MGLNADTVSFAGVLQLPVPDMTETGKFTGLKAHRLQNDHTVPISCV